MKMEIKKLQMDDLVKTGFPVLYQEMMECAEQLTFAFPERQEELLNR